MLKELRCGTQLWLVPGHCDPTVNNYDEFVGIKTNLSTGVEIFGRWTIDGRGPGI